MRSPVRSTWTASTSRLVRSAAPAQSRIPADSDHRHADGRKRGHNTTFSGRFRIISASGVLRARKVGDGTLKLTVLKTPSRAARQSIPARSKSTTTSCGVAVTIYYRRDPSRRRRHRPGHCQGWRHLRRKRLYNHHRRRNDPSGQRYTDNLWLARLRRRGNRHDLGPLGPRRDLPRNRRLRVR